ncbi:hypothetical protein QQ054_25210 [Oscillatoria amoena NRMC-F 0135]|nr:hypothetical protein [Oscillatoria amoena NRMC-F 0135]
MNQMAFAQGYDQLKTQLMFENFYGSKMRSSARTINEVGGSETLLDDWHPIEIVFANGSTRFEQGKINLFNATAEVIYKDQEMFIATQHLKRINLPHLNRSLIPADNYEFKGVSLNGFVEVFNPELNLPYILINHYVYIKKPSTNGYINGGTTQEKFVKSSKIYVVNGDNLEPYKGKKSVDKLFSGNKEKYLELVKKHNTDFKNPKSVQKLIDAMRN